MNVAKRVEVKCGLMVGIELRDQGLGFRVLGV